MKILVITMDVTCDSQEQFNLIGYGDSFIESFKMILQKHGQNLDKEVGISLFEDIISGANTIDLVETEENWEKTLESGTGEFDDFLEQMVFLIF